MVCIKVPIKEINGNPIETFKNLDTDSFMTNIENTIGIDILNEFGTAIGIVNGYDSKCLIIELGEFYSHIPEDKSFININAVTIPNIGVIHIVEPPTLMVR